jgi:hypothetical protein
VEGATAAGAAPEEILEIAPNGLDVCVGTPTLQQPITGGPFPRPTTSSMFDATHQPITDQLNSTALKWGNDGELSELDLQRILGLLSQADPVAEALIGHRSDAA